MTLYNNDLSHYVCSTKTVIGMGVLNMNLRQKLVVTDLQLKNCVKHVTTSAVCPPQFFELCDI